MGVVRLQSRSNHELYAVPLRFPKQDDYISWSKVVFLKTILLISTTKPHYFPSQKPKNTRSRKKITVSRAAFHVTTCITHPAGTCTNLSPPKLRICSVDPRLLSEGNHNNIRPSLTLTRLDRLSASTSQKSDLSQSQIRQRFGDPSC